jgi:diguanylate cyclase (GGDEF)-like protein
MLWMSWLIPMCAVAQQYAFHDDSENEGLNSLTVNCLLQDHAGLLWVCTENGLYTFDGSTYARIGAAQGLSDSYIVSIHEDAQGELWVGTSNHLYHGNARQFRAIPSGTYGIAGANGQQLGSTVAGQVLAVSHHRLFQLTRAGPGNAWSVSPFFPQASLASYPELDSIASVYVGRSGHVWLGCGNAICEVSGNSVKVWGLQEGVSADTWSWFLEDSAGRLWARGFGHIVALSQRDTAFANEDIRSAPVTFHSPYLPIVEDAAHRILTRTDRGLAIWSQGSWQTLDAANGLKFPDITALLLDREGEFWLGTFGKGVEHWLGYGNWEIWAAEQGLADNPVWNLTRDHLGTLWAATDSGIATLDSKRASFVLWHPHAAVLPGQVATVLEARDRSLWFSTWAGRLLHYLPAGGEIRQTMLPVGLRQVWLDSSGRAWALSKDGIYVADPALKSIAKVHDPAVADQVVSDACEDGSHALWFASKSGLLRFSAGQWTHVAVPDKEAVDGFVSVACSADGTLWLGGASAGVSHLRVTQAATGAVANDADPQPPQELNSAEVMFLRFDRRGWIWIGTGSGVYVFNGTMWRHVTEKDGLAWNDCNEGAFLADDDGSVWIGTSNGLSHLLHPEKLFEQQELRIITVDAMLGDARVAVDGSSSFAWTGEPFRVHLATSAIGDQSSIVYRYRLAGLEKNWSASKSQDLNYTSLPDGKYRLELYAEDSDRGIRSSLTSISFRVRPPWWRSIPFEIGLGSCLLAMVFGLVRFRERNLKLRQAQLEALVSARTEDLQLEKQQLMEAREALRELALHDSLTGLLNHGAICDVLGREMARCQRDGTALTIVMIDLDHFKLVNDSHGHIAGDAVLREVARRITCEIRPYDAAGRYGGEEFLLILPDFDAVRDPSRLAIVHQSICGEPVQVPDVQVNITCSFGVAVLRSDRCNTAVQFLDQADKALYRAKDAGRNRIIFDEALQIS